MDNILNKYSIIYSFYYRINKKYYREGHAVWTNINCFIVNAGFMITVVFGFILLLGIDVTSKALINTAIIVLVLDSLFVVFYNKSRVNELLMLKEEEFEVVLWMKVVHIVSLFLSYIAPNFLYTLCLGEEFIW